MFFLIQYVIRRKAKPQTLQEQKRYDDSQKILFVLFKLYYEIIIAIEKYDDAISLFGYASASEESAAATLIGAISIKFLQQFMKYSNRTLCEHRPYYLSEKSSAFSLIRVQMAFLVIISCFLLNDQLSSLALNESYGIQRDPRFAIC